MTKEQEELIEYLLTFHKYHYEKYPEGQPWWNIIEERSYGSVGFHTAIQQIIEYFNNSVPKKK